jgi:hypothetical protein
MSQDRTPQPRKQQKTLPTPQLYQKNQPIWKIAIIQFLRGTIGILENTVVKLETEPSPTTEKKPHLLARVFLAWDKFLQIFRLFLPSKVANNVSDFTLTAIFAIFAVVIVGVTATFLTPKPTKVATIPPDIPLVAEVTTPEPTPEPIPEPTPEPTPETTPEPTPEPEAVQLTPEQALIAAIEQQLAEITVITVQTKEDENIAINLIKSIQANFRTSDLTITISDDWYTLEPSRQQQLAADILKRSQELDFTHLQLVDAENKLIARSPVVGNEMIMFSKHS